VKVLNVPKSEVFGKAVERCVAERRVGAVHRLAPELETSRRIVVRSLLLGAEDGALASADLKRAAIEAELRADLGAIVAGAEPQHHGLSYAARALPAGEIPILLDIAWAPDRRYEREAIGFPASAVRLAFR
jgi:hypothetical protein